MKKIIFGLIFAFVFMLAGCKNENASLFSYQEENKEASYLFVDEQQEYADLFSKDLCIIPVNQKLTIDTNLNAGAALSINITKNELVYGDHIYDKMYPASLTKLATAYVVLKYGNLSDTVEISKNAANISISGAKLCGFKEGDKITLENLLNCFLIYSGNDAGIALAEYIANTEENFAQIMNEEIKVLGAVNTHFVNSHGLHDDNHYTTAYDLYLIFQKLIQDERFIEIIQKGEIEAEYQDKNGAVQKKIFKSTDKYLTGEETAPEGITVIGGKTGTTNAAGYCLVLLSESDKKEKYISIILKSSSTTMLFSQMSYLLKLIY